MKRKLNLKRFMMFITVLIAISFYGATHLLRLFGDTPVAVPPEPEPTPQGVLRVINYQLEEDYPISNSEFQLIDQMTGEVRAILITDESGKASSIPLDFDGSYRLIQKQVAAPYVISTEALFITIQEELQEVTIKNALKEHIKGTTRTETGELRVTSVDFPVETVMQLPELPNGCEITSLSAVLNAYGYATEKTQMADVYLKKEAFYRREGQLFGANPYLAFAGNPREQSGFFVYAPPVVNAANQYLSEEESPRRALDLSGRSQEAILQHLIQEGPVVIWVTLDLTPPRLNYSWMLAETDETFIAPVNLHAVVLRGFDEENVYVMNPLQGQMTHRKDIFFESYFALGSHALGLTQ